MRQDFLQCLQAHLPLQSSPHVLTGTVLHSPVDAVLLLPFLCHRQEHLDTKKGSSLSRVF